MHRWKAAVVQIVSFFQVCACNVYELNKWPISVIEPNTYEDDDHEAKPKGHLLPPRLAAREDCLGQEPGIYDAGGQIKRPHGTGGSQKAIHSTQINCGN